MDHSRAVPLGDISRAVGGTIVCNHYFADDAGCYKRSEGFIDAGSNRPFFVQARDHNGNLGASVHTDGWSLAGRFRSGTDVGNSVHDLFRAGNRLLTPLTESARNVVFRL